jgi:hypothetical protein
MESVMALIACVLGKPNSEKQHIKSYHIRSRNDLLNVRLVVILVVEVAVYLLCIVPRMLQVPKP